MNSDPHETTPLLSTSIDTQNEDPLPVVEDGINALRHQEIRALNIAEQHPISLSTDAAQTAYKLLVLLRWQIVIKIEACGTSDVWEIHSRQKKLNQDVKALRHSVDSVWSDFIKEHRTPKEIDDVLLLQFPLERNGRRVIRGAFFVKRKKSRLSHVNWYQWWT